MFLKNKFYLLSSCLSSCVFVLLVANNAEARRLIPEQPSVEVHYEALNILRANIDQNRIYAQPEPTYIPELEPKIKHHSVHKSRPVHESKSVIIKSDLKPAPIIMKREVAKKTTAMPKPSPILIKTPQPIATDDEVLLDISADDIKADNNAHLMELPEQEIKDDALLVPQYANDNILEPLNSDELLPIEPEKELQTEKPKEAIAELPTIKLPVSPPEKQKKTKEGLFSAAKNKVRGLFGDDKQEIAKQENILPEHQAISKPAMLEKSTVNSNFKTDVKSNKLAKSDELPPIASIENELPELPQLPEIDEELSLDNEGADLPNLNSSEELSGDLPPLEGDSQDISLASLDNDKPTIIQKVTNNNVDLQIIYDSNEVDIPLDAQDKLKKIAIKLGNDKNATIYAYAGGGKDSATMARRVSLSRALAVRSYLIDQGIDNLHINVQAKGNENDGGNPERIDIIIKNL